MFKYRKATLYQKWYYGVNKYHRVGGPAYIEVGKDSGLENEYIVGGVEHNLNGPSDYSKCYFYRELAGKLHCITGPAVTRNWTDEWYINGIEYTEDAFNRIMKVEDAKV